MALSIKDPEADRLAREISKRTGESLTEAVLVSLRERLRRLSPARHDSLQEEVERIALRYSARPRLDPRSAEEILGYGESGVPN